MSENKKHLNIRIYGKVQGIFFRDTTRKKAKELGISGFVENKTDGSVYIEVEGPEEKLQEFLEWIEKGPPLAEIQNMKKEEGKLEKYKGFEVKY